MKNILMGFLMATCMFLMIGLVVPPKKATNTDSGRYQAIDSNGGILANMIDTKTGEFYYWGRKENSKVADRYRKGGVWKKISAKSNWIEEYSLGITSVDDK